jgi:hypothetical protein
MLILYISALNTSKQRFLEQEQFKNNIDNDVSKEIEGDCKNITRPHELYTPTAVNIPSLDNIPPPLFNTYKNYPDDVKNTLDGKYCFPIEKLMYDGIWDGHVKYINNKVPEKQQRNWKMSDKVKTHGLYCGDQFLKLPDKTLCIGDEVISSDDCAKFYPKPSEVEEKIKECTLINTCFEPTCFEKTGLIETTNGRWNINGL